MAAGQIIVPGAMPTRDRNGRATVGKLFFYEDGTQTPKAVYTASDLATELANPVVSNAAGRFPAIWADDAELYTVVWTYDDEETIQTYSGVSAAEDAVLASVALAEAAADEAAADAVQTAADLAAIQAIEAAGSTAPAIAGKLNRNGDNAEAGLYAAVGAQTPALTAATDVQDADLLASYRSTGPLKKLTATILGSYVVKTLTAFLQAGTGATARTPQAKMRETVSPEDFGAAGNGTTNDTTPFQAAINTGKSVRATPGATYLCGPLTQSTADQVIDLTGATLKLLAGSNTHQISLAGAHAKVIGGTIDGNKAAGQVLIDGGYNLSAVYLGAAGTGVDGVRCINSAGLGIKGGQFDNIYTINCNVSAYDVQGIYFEATTAVVRGWRADNNLVTMAAATNSGIYFTGSQDNPTFAFRPKEWSVCGNRVIGPTSGTTGTDICITLHCEDGVCSNNWTSGGDMGISADIASRSTFTGNRIENTVGVTSYGIEVNGAKNAITGNVIVGGRQGIVMSGVLPLSNNNISGNNISGVTEKGIYIIPNAGVDGKGNNICGNHIDMSSAPAACTAINVARDYKGLMISGNTFIGPGSSSLNSIVLYAESGDGYVSLIGNRMRGFEQVTNFYNIGAVAQRNITINDNDCTVDMLTDDTFIAVSGLASIGAYCVQRNNSHTTGARRDYIDRQNSVIDFTFDQSPEGIIPAAMGSRVYDTTNGKLWFKRAGASTAGWGATPTYREGSATYDPPNLVDGDGVTTTVTVTGAVLGEYARASFSLNLQGITVTAWVSAADTVSVRFQNETGGAIDLGSGTLRARAEPL